MTDSRIEEAFRDFPRIRQLAERATAHVSHTLDDGADGPRAAPTRGERGRGDPGAGAGGTASC